MFYREQLTFQGTPAIGFAALRQRTLRGNRKLRGALAATETAGVVFFDSDIGIERTIPKHAGNRPEHILVW